MEIGPGADHVAWDHWLYPHAHHEQGTNAVTEHLPYEKTMLNFLKKKKILTTKFLKMNSIPITASEQ